MMSKKDKLFLALEQIPIICPTCGAAMVRNGDDLVCEKKHRVNGNRKGCLNVLSSKQETYYDELLFAARERVFAAGLYRQVVEAIGTLLPSSAKRILDAGCGEGWYLNQLLMADESRAGAGVDISRDAIFRATNHPATALWLVGDLRRLPFADGTFDTVLDVLTPANYAEFARVLKKDGLLLKVYPGRGYLKEIREKRGMELYEEGQVDAYLRDRGTVVDAVHVVNTVSISPELWRDFVWMTPLNQNLTANEKDALARKASDCITIDLHVTAVRL